MWRAAWRLPRVRVRWCARPAYGAGPWGACPASCAGSWSAGLGSGAKAWTVEPMRAVRAMGSSPDYMDRPEPPRPGLVQRFKQMYRDYWYVLVPVHLATSAVWFGGFYYAVRSGVDVISMLEWMGLSERFVEPMRDSEAGYFALTYALYKIATPLRYAVTVGGTTVTINKLTAVGWIRPVPSKARIKELIQEKREDFQGAYEETKQELRQRRDQMKERKSQVLEDLKRYKQEMRDIKKNEIKNK